MNRVLILHGYEGSDTKHWQSYLACELVRKYGCVSFPLINDKDKPDLNLWMAQIKKEISEFKPNVIVTHSLGGTLLFHIINSGFEFELDKLLLVAPPRLDLKLENTETFFPLSLPKKLPAKKSLLVVSDNDKYLSLDEALQIQNNLDIDMKILKDSGHINATSGFGEWNFPKKWIDE